MIESVSSNLEKLLSGKMAEFCNWIRAQMPDGLSPFERACVEADLELLTDAF